MDTEKLAWGETFFDSTVLWLSTEIDLTKINSVPQTHSEAMNRPDAEKWRIAESLHFMSMSEANFAEVVDEAEPRARGKTVLSRSPSGTTLSNIRRKWTSCIKLVS